MTWRFLKLSAVRTIVCLTKIQPKVDHMAKINKYVTILDYCKFQKMRCILCHNVQQEKVGQSSTQSEKNLVMYNKDHDTTTMNCHVILKHFAILKLYQI